MNKEELLFYEPYERFYDMASHSKAFADYCREAFGEDFSQDGFSDTKQTDMILSHIPLKNDTKILDIGCGNGKMLGYLKRKTGAHICGFDYSQSAVRDAKKRYPDAEIEEGVIGEKENVSAWENHRSTEAPIPKTGFLWWPVPVLGVAGLILILVGITLRKSGERDV